MKRNRTQYMRDYRELNAAKLKPAAVIRSKAWVAANPDKQRERVQRYRLSHLEDVRVKRAKYMREKRNANPTLRIYENLRRRLNKVVHGFFHMKELGCAIGELHLYLENYFPLYKGMTWDNYGEWHVDHIVPLSHFDLSNHNELLLACHYTNLQPLWSFDNLSKGAKLCVFY